MTGNTGVRRELQAVTISLVLGSDQPVGGPPTRNVVNGASNTPRRARSPNVRVSSLEKASMLLIAVR